MIKVSRHVWVFPYEETHDRPNLGYIRGSHFSIAIDAGHSKEHISAFYEDLAKNGLPLPQITVLTHWHWDHTFAMHAVNGITICEKRTEAHLEQLLEEADDSFQKRMMQMDPCIALEYEKQEMKVVPADLAFENAMEINAGGVHVQLFHIPSPHTDDSTAIFVTEDKVLFVGDAPSGAYPDYDQIDSLQQEAMRTALIPVPFEICIGGHWPLEDRKTFLECRMQ